MNVLLIGNGGREHAIAWKLAQSKNLTKLYTAPGNPGTAQFGENIDISVDNADELLDFSKKNDIAKAVNAFRKAHQYLPENEKYDSRFMEEKNKFDQINREIQQAQKEAVKSLKFEDSIKKLEEKIIYESSFPQIAESIKQIKKEASKHFENQLFRGNR